MRQSEFRSPGSSIRRMIFAFGLGPPALLAGPNGLDLGAFVPAGARHFRRAARSHSLDVGDSRRWRASITHYRFRVNDGVFSDEQPVSRPIILAGLADGNYTVFVIGKNSAGVWQPETKPTASRTWSVDRSSSALVINEILARNVAALTLADSSPGFIELFNRSDTALDLAGMSLSNDFRVPRKFVFPLGTQLPVAGFLAVFADNRETSSRSPSRFHAERRRRRSVFLYDKPANGARLIDSVTFGLQVPDLSIRRLGDGVEGFCRVTFDAENLPTPLMDASALEISNGWLVAGSPMRTIFLNCTIRSSFRWLWEACF